MQKQYLFINVETEEAVGFNANSIHQARIKMKRIAKYLFNSHYSVWKFEGTKKKIKRNR